MTDIEALVAAGVLDEDERVELIGGELVPMLPKGHRQEVPKVALLRRWYRAAPDDIVPETTFRFTDDTYFEPDVVVYDRAAGLKNLAAATVLLVVEIADSSLRYDTGRKAAFHAGFGVRELWVIDPVRLEMRVFLLPGSDGYAEVRDAAASETILPAFAPAAFALEIAALEIEG